MFDTFQALNFGTPGINGGIQSPPPPKDGVQAQTIFDRLFNRTPQTNGDTQADDFWKFILFGGAKAEGTATGPFDGATASSGGSDTQNTTGTVGAEGKVPGSSGGVNLTGNPLVDGFLMAFGNNHANVTKAFVGVLLYGVLAIGLVEFIKPGIASDAAGQVTDGAKKAAKAVVAE